MIGCLMKHSLFQLHYLSAIISGIAADPPPPNPYCRLAFNAKKCNFA